MWPFTDVSALNGDRQIGKVGLAALLSSTWFKGGGKYLLQVSEKSGGFDRVMILDKKGLFERNRLRKASVLYGVTNKRFVPTIQGIHGRSRPFIEEIHDSFHNLEHALRYGFSNPQGVSGVVPIDNAKAYLTDLLSGPWGYEVGGLESEESISRGDRYFFELHRFVPFAKKICRISHFRERPVESCPAIFTAPADVVFNVALAVGEPTERNAKLDLYQGLFHGTEFSYRIFESDGTIFEEELR